MKRKISNSSVKAIFDAFPKEVKETLLFLRQLIYDTAQATKGVGELEETLKWGEPSYVTNQTKSGSTIRINVKMSDDGPIYFMLFNCKTTIVASIKQMYGDLFEYQGNRALVFHDPKTIPEIELKNCITLALTYHLYKKKKTN